MVTGATGFIGRALLTSLLESHNQTAVLIRPQTNSDRLVSVVGQDRVFVDDPNPKTLAEQLEKFSPDLTVHLASCFVVQHQAEQVQEILESNVLFPTRLLEALKLIGCRRLLNTGTSWQHFENAQYRPVNLYAASKQAFEDLAHYYSDAHGFQIVNLKLHDTYGEGDTRPKLFATLKRVLESGEELALSPGEQKIDLLHIEDVVRAFLLCIESFDDFDRWNSFVLSSGRSIPLRDLVRVFERVAGKKLNVNFGARPYRDREVMTPWNRGQTLPNWQPKVELKSGIERFLHA